MTYGFLGIGEGIINTFRGVLDTNAPNNAVIEQTSKMLASAIDWLWIIGLVLALCAIVYAIITFALMKQWSDDDDKRNDAKKKLKASFISGGVILLIPILISIIAMIIASSGLLG